MSEGERLTSNMVSFDGPLTAKLCFIGEAPGREEDEAPVPTPFVGAAGRLLNRCLKTVGMLRSEVLIHNVFVQRPPKNDVGYFFQDAKMTRLTWEGEEHVKGLERFLKKLLALREQTGVGPNVLVALGRVPMLFLTGKHRISKWRGSVLPCTLVPGFKVYVTYHPSFVQRMMEERGEVLQGDKKVQAMNALPLFLKDLERAEIQSRESTFNLPRRSFVICDSAQRAIDEIKKLDGEELVSVDIETLRGDDGPILWFIGFSPRPDYAFTIPFIRNLRFQWSQYEEALIKWHISRFFLSETKKIFQGGSYDLSVLGRYHGLRVANGTYEDTMLYHHASFPYLKKALETLVSIHTWEPYYKDDGKVWDGRRISDEAEGIYNCRDCACTREIYSPIRRDALELGTESGYRRTLSVFPSVLYMQIRGVRIDLEKKKLLTKSLGERSELAEKTVNFLAGHEVNPSSPVQMNRLLYSELGLPIQYDRKTQKPTTDKHAIQALLRGRRDPKDPTTQLLRALLDYRKFDKLRSTYAEMEVDSDGRIHTSYNWITTWRLSSSESPFGKGGNLQNIPIRSEEGREIRTLFIPDSGLVFLARDYRQAEAMVVAWLARDRRLMELFESGVDVHWERTKDLFDLPESMDYSNPKERVSVRGFEEPVTLKWLRDLTKRFVHGFNYKMGFRKQHAILLTEGIDVPLEFCRDSMVQLRNKNPFTVQWQNRVEEKIRRDRTLITPLGRKREFRGRLSDELIRGAVAFVPQSTVGEMTQIGCQRVHELVPEFEILLNVHDETLGQCRPEDVPYCGRKMAELMTIPLQIEGRELIIGGDLKSGPNWGDMKEITI